MKLEPALRPGADAPEAIGAHGDVEGRHVLCPDDADRPPSRTACQRAGFDHGHGNAALNQVERTRQAECTPADDYDMQRAHSLDGSIETDHFSVGTVTRLTAQFSILQLTCCRGSSPARPEVINWIGG